MMTYSKQLPVRNNLREMFLFDSLNSEGAVCVCLRIDINLWLEGYHYIGHVQTAQLLQELHFFEIIILKFGKESFVHLAESYTPCSFLYQLKS